MVEQTQITASLLYEPPQTRLMPSVPVWIEVDLAAIQHNLREIRKYIGPRVKLLAVVKANGYGHGLVQTARAVAAAGADYLGVASVLEGVTLRQHGISSKILVLGQLLPEEAPIVVEHRLVQAIGDWTVARALSRAAVLLEKPALVQLKIDTGMGRYGVWHAEAPELARRIAELHGVRVEGTFTHMASGGQDRRFSEEQMDRFNAAVRKLVKAKLPVGLQHAANSVSLIRFPQTHRDLVRSGLLLYGASPLRDQKLPLHVRPALSLKSRVRFLKTVAAGRTVSYGAAFKATRSTRVATVPVGYAHGYSRALSNKADALVRGARARVLGRITMEDLMIDVTGIPDVQVGDEVTLIGRQGKEAVTAQELALHARTIPYEVLAGLSANIPRRYAPVSKNNT